MKRDDRLETRNRLLVSDRKGSPKHAAACFDILLGRLAALLVMMAVLQSWNAQELSMSVLEWCGRGDEDRFQVTQILTFEQLKNDVFGLHWKNEAWHEILRLITGKVSERHAEQLIVFLLDNARFTHTTLGISMTSKVLDRHA